jgi:hypothetical protein
MQTDGLLRGPVRSKYAMELGDSRQISRLLVQQTLQNYVKHFSDKKYVLFKHLFLMLKYFIIIIFKTSTSSDQKRLLDDLV